MVISSSSHLGGTQGDLKTASDGEKIADVGRRKGMTSGLVWDSLSANVGMTVDSRVFFQLMSGR